MYLALPCAAGERAQTDKLAPCVLVGRVRDAAQLQANLDHLFYHIPARMFRFRLPPTSHVALFISEFESGQKQGVYYIAQVCSVSIVKRCDIKEIEKNSTEPYYLFKVKRWTKLAHPLPYAANRAAPYFYSSLFLIENSRSTASLLLGTEDDFLLFSQIQQLMTLNDPKIGFYCGKFRLCCNGSSILISCADTVRARFRTDTFRMDPVREYRRIRAVITEK